MKKQRRPLTETEQQDSERLKKVWDIRSRELNLTQLDASKQFGFANQSAVSQYLNAKIPLNLDAAAKFAKILHVSIADISPTHADSLRSSNVCARTFCPISTQVPSDSTVIPSEEIIGDPLDETRWYVVHKDAKIVSAGCYLLEAGDKLKMIKVEASEDGFTLIGLAAKPTTVTKEVAAMLPVKGQVLYKISKV